jgi:hypothetical protein
MDFRTFFFCNISFPHHSSRAFYLRPLNATLHLSGVSFFDLFHSYMSGFNFASHPSSEVRTSNTLCPYLGLFEPTLAARQITLRHSFLGCFL